MTFERAITMPDSLAGMALKNHCGDDVTVGPG